jgi:hypothetical protein
MRYDQFPHLSKPESSAVTTCERAPGDILWLGEPACHDRTVVGRKAANLSRLTATHRVPPASVLRRRSSTGHERVVPNRPHCHRHSAMSLRRLTRSWPGAAA